jgi:predicted transcriptional regulator with HTH domain
MRERPNAEEDTRIERQVVFLVLHAYPELLTEAELEREIARDPDDFGERDVIARAVFSLVTLGLVHCCGPLVIPSRAALRLYAMEQEDSPGEAA